LAVETLLTPKITVKIVLNNKMNSNAHYSVWNALYRIYLFICGICSFSLVVDGCVTWYFVVREEHRLRIFKSRALRKVFAAKRERERT
jgi:hypothetical protein